MGLAVSGVELLSTIIAAPVAIWHLGWNDRVWVAGSRWKRARVDKRVFWPEYFKKIEYVCFNWFYAYII